MVEQSQDSSASTAQSQAETPAGGAESNSANRPHSPPPPPTEGGGAENKGGRRGGAEKSSAPRGLLRPLILARLARGESVKAVARGMGIHRSTVQFHRDSLVASGALKQVRQDRYSPGPSYATEAVGGGADSDRAPPANATAPWLATDGSRTFEILAAPANVDSLPGFVGTKLTGRSKNDAKKRRDHRIVWTHDGRSFDLLLMESPGAIGHGWSLQLKKVRPAPYLASIQATPDEDREVAWDRFTFNAVQVWAKSAGVAVNPDRSRVRRSTRLSMALGGVVDPAVKFRSPDADADATPVPGTVEVRTEQLKAFLETGPEAQASMGRQLAAMVEWQGRMEAEVAVAKAGVEGVQTVTGKTVRLLAEVQAVLQQQAEALVTIAQTEVATLSSPILPKRSLSPDSGVDVS